MSTPRKRPRIGLALGGGGAAALAEIGVLAVLRDAGIPIDCVAGTSAGSLVGAALAAGRLDELGEALSNLTRRRALWLFNPVWPRRGLFVAKSSMDFIRPYIGDEIENLSIPFAAIAADLDTGEEVILDRGSVSDAIRASIAIPGLFAPFRIGDRWLVDGALADPLPVGPARALGADFVIAVHVLPMGDRTHSTFFETYRSLRRGGRAARLRELVVGGPTEDADTEAIPTPVDLWNVLSQASRIVQARIAIARLREEAPDFLIHVPLPAESGLFDFESVRASIASGRRVAEAALDDLRIAMTVAPRRGALARLRSRLASRRRPPVLVPGSVPSVA